MGKGMLFFIWGGQGMGKGEKKEGREIGICQVWKGRTNNRVE